MSVLSRDKWNKLSHKKNLEGDEALRAVKRDGHALRYVIDQTDEICLAAVKQNGHALQYVKDQTEAICLVAVRENGYALRFVEERFLDSDSCGGKVVEVDGKKYTLTPYRG